MKTFESRCLQCDALLSLREELKADYVIPARLRPTSLPSCAEAVKEAAIKMGKSIREI